MALFQGAAAWAVQVPGGVRPEQLDGPTPCSEWSVQHRRGARRTHARESCSGGAVAAGLRVVGGGGGRRHFMDNLVHTGDLATATGQDRELDDDLVRACVAMFLLDMPERGRAAGIVGPEVAVPSDASAQDRLLGAMGRRR